METAAPVPMRRIIYNIHGAPIPIFETCISNAESTAKVSHPGMVVIILVLNGDPNVSLDADGFLKTLPLGNPSLRHISG